MRDLSLNKHVFPLKYVRFSKYSVFAGNLPRKLFSCYCLENESSPRTLPEEREAQYPQNVAQIDEVNNIVLCETSNSPAKVRSILQSAPKGAEIVGGRVGDEDRDLTIADKNCVLTSSEEDVEDLSAFVAEKLHCLSKRSVIEFIGDESVNVEEIRRASIGVGEDVGDKIRSVCPKVTLVEDVEASERRFSPGEEINQILQHELGSVNITSTAKRVAWPVYTKRRSSVLSEQQEPTGKALIINVVTDSGRVGG